MLATVQLDVVYLLIIVAAVVLQGSLAAYAWRYRQAPGVRLFVAVCVGSGAWLSLVGGMAIASPGTARVVLSLKYIAIGATSVLTFLLIGRRTERFSPSTHWRTSALFVIPAVGHLASWWDGGGMVERVEFGEAFNLTHVASISFGPLYWIFAGYLYALLLGGLTFLVLARQQDSPLARPQAAALAVAVLAPLATNVLLITGLSPRAFDPMPLGLTMSGLALWWATFHGRLLELVPVARHVLVDTLDDGILIVDCEGRVLEVNRRFADLAGVDADSMVGRTLASGLPDDTIRELLRKALAPAAPTATRSVHPPRATLALGERAFDARVVEVAGTDLTPVARIVVLRDVTERQHWQDEQARLIDELQRALSHVKTLTGLLPICAGCKRLRDDAGTWHELEAYLHARTDATFTHGMCPTCMASWYPELVAPAAPR